MPTALQEQSGKNKSACSVQNDGGGRSGRPVEEAEKKRRRVELGAEKWRSIPSHSLRIKLRHYEEGTMHRARTGKRLEARI
jgi:hypothetical protein